MEKLGTLEFCSALNGDDPIQAMNALKRFVQTVRRERVEALGVGKPSTEVSPEIEEPLSSDDDESVDTSESPSKRQKVEEWKYDTKSYNVPFVGTSTYKGTCGVVEKGKWPTGLLEAFLEQSPKAMEILGDGSNNKESALIPPHGHLHESLLKQSSGKRLSSKLFILFIQALGEIATCGVPTIILKRQLNEVSDINEISDEYSAQTAKLENTDHVNLSYQRIISSIMKDHVVVLYNILNNEKSNTSSHSHLLVEAVLSTLAGLASTSIGAVREIVRGLDSNLKDGVLQKLAPSKIKNKSSSNQNGTSDKKQTDRKNTEVRASSAYIALASVMLESNDLVTLSHVISQGDKQTKARPGIAFIAVRRVDVANAFSMINSNVKPIVRRRYFKILLRLFRSIRIMLTSANDQDGDNFGRISSTLLTSFLQSEVLDIITRNAYINVDDNEDEIWLRPIKSECHLIIDMLLSDSQQSPFLQLISSTKSPRNIELSIISNLTKCIQLILTSSPNAVSTRNFVLRCFQNTPKLFTSFLKVMSIPETASSFACISRYSFIAFLIENGPFPYNSSMTAEAVLSFIIPKNLTKNAITKTLQNANTILLLECLKVISTVLEKLCKYKEHTYGKSLTEDYLNLVRKRLPEVQVLLSIGRSKFNPFVDKTNTSERTINSVVTMNICNVLQLYATAFASSVTSLQFDWMKLLPENCDTFCAADHYLQVRLLSTLASINCCHKMVGAKSFTFSTSRAFRTFCSIMTKTNEFSVYEQARNLSIKTMTNIVGIAPSHEDSVLYELSGWVDAVSIANIPTFCDLLEATQKVTVQHDVIISNSFHKYYPLHGITEIGFTPIISTALSSIASDTSNFDESFINIICKVTTATLLQQRNPRPLVCVVKFLLCNSQTLSKGMRSLVGLASSIIDQDKNLMQITLAHLNDVFGQNNARTKLADYLSNKVNDSSMLESIYNDATLDPSIASLLVRQCVYFSRFNYDDAIDKTKVHSVILKIFPIIVERMDNDSHLIRDILELDQHLSKSTIATLLTTSSSLFVKKGDTDKPQDSMSTSFVESITSLIRTFFSAKLDDNSNKDGLAQYSMELSFIGAILPLVSNVRGSNLLQETIDFCALNLSSCNDPSQLVYVLEKLFEHQTQQQLQQLPGQSLFRLWYSLLKHKDSDVKIMKSILEQIMSTVLMNYEDNALNAAQILSKMRHALRQNDVNSTISVGALDPLFLISLVTVDASTFIPPCLQIAMETNDNTDVMATIILQINAQKPHLIELPSIAIETTIHSFVTAIADGNWNITILVFHALNSMLSYDQLSLSIFEKIYLVAPAFFQGLRKKRKNGNVSCKELSFLEFMNNCISTKQLHGVRDSIAALVLMHYSLSLLQILKSSENEDNCYTFLSQVIQTIKSLNENEVFSVKASLIKKIMVACLKFGIQGDSRCSTQCILIVRLLLLVSTPSIKDHKEGILMPHQIFAMSISHSNFLHLATKKNSPSRRELISLLIYCVDFSKKDIGFLDWKKISALLAGFNASLDHDDLLLRRLLYLYEHHVSQIKSDMYCQSNFFWGSKQLKLLETNSSAELNYIVGTGHGERWEPLIELLEMKRVRQTITNFPYWETAIPPFQTGVESAVKCNVETSSIDSSDMHSKVESANNDFRGRERKKENCYIPVDERYSPAFVLPLILGALESFALRASIDGKCKNNLSGYDDVGSNKNDHIFDQQGTSAEDPNIQYRESFAKFAYRLYQKGALSLCLSCLSSRCESLRGLAISCLYYFLTALKLKESHEIAQWRERPQLEMILNSVQRGIVVAKAKMSSEAQGNQTGDSSSLSIPVFPAVSALFLARAALIAGKPADEMYSSINGHFLRLKDFHGAYNDCFSLPAFMILFCSTHDDNNQDRRERIWSLQLLRDGIIDEYSYKVVSRRHVIELLMSSFDGFCHHNRTNVYQGKQSFSYETECNLIIAILQRCFSCGGLTCYNHLFKSMGLISWIQMMIESHSELSYINLKFFQMVFSALQAIKQCIQSNPEETSELLFIDVIALCQSIMSACETKFSGPHCKSSSVYVLSTTLSGILALSREVHEEMASNQQIMFEPCNNGIHMTSAMKFLKSIEHDAALLQKSVIALSYFPIDFGNEDSTTSTVCEFANIMISFVRNIDAQNENDVVSTSLLNVMKKVKTMCHLFKKTLINDNGVAESLIGCRRKMTEMGLFEAWFETLSILVPIAMDKEGNHSYANDENDKSSRVKLIVESELFANRKN